MRLCVRWAHLARYMKSGQAPQTPFEQMRDFAKKAGRALFEPSDVVGPPKEPKILAQYLKIESIGSIGSIILAILEVQVVVGLLFLVFFLWVVY